MPDTGVVKAGLLTQGQDDLLKRLRETKRFKSSLLDRVEATGYKVQVIDENLKTLVTPKDVANYKSESLKNIKKQIRDYKLIKKSINIDVKKGIQGAKQDLDEVNNILDGLENQLRGLKGFKLKLTLEQKVRKRKVTSSCC